MVNQYWITPVIRSAKGVPMNDHWAINGLIYLGSLRIMKNVHRGIMFWLPVIYKLMGDHDYLRLRSSLWCNLPPQRPAQTWVTAYLVKVIILALKY